MRKVYYALIAIVIGLVIFDAWFFLSPKPIVCYEELDFCVYGNWEEAKQNMISKNVHFIVEGDDFESDRNKYITNASAVLGLWIGSLLTRANFSSKDIAYHIDYCTIGYDLNGTPHYSWSYYNGTTYTKPKPVNTCNISGFYIWIKYPNQEKNEVILSKDGIVVKARTPPELYAIALILRREFS